MFLECQIINLVRFQRNVATGNSILLMLLEPTVIHASVSLIPKDKVDFSRATTGRIDSRGIKAIGRTCFSCMYLDSLKHTEGINELPDSPYAACAFELRLILLVEKLIFC